MRLTSFSSCRWALSVGLTFLLGQSPAAGQLSDTIEPKVMVIATYETGKDRGDVPGELQNWVERENLDQSIPVPGLDHPVLTNGKGLYAMVSGTTSRCAIQMMTLAMDKRFDLKKTYFLLSGIAGGDPAACSVSSAAWITVVVDGDPIFEIDSRETPAAWPYGTVALGATEPGQPPPNVDSLGSAGVSDGSGGVGQVVFHLDAGLADWAYHLTKDVVLPDSPKLADWRSKFLSFPNAIHPPQVLEGASLGADRFWHGAIMNHWAQDWVRLYTKGTGSLMMSDCEDQGICLAMTRLDQLGLIDFHRLLILRSCSNYTVPPPGVSAARDLFDSLVVSPGYIPSLEANHTVGSVVTSALLKNWAVYKDQPPHN